MKKINWGKIAEYAATTVFFIIAAAIAGWAFFMLFNMIREIFRNW